MPSRKFTWDPEHWRFRAEETRTVADQMTHEESRTIMRRIAMDYDRLAKLAEVQLIQEATEPIARFSGYATHLSPFLLPQSSSASRFTAGCCGYLLLIQCRD